MDTTSIAQWIAVGTIGLLILGIAVLLHHARQNHNDALERVRVR